MNARKENYEYFAYYYKLRNKVTNKIRQDIVNAPLRRPKNNLSSIPCSETMVP